VIVRPRPQVLAALAVAFVTGVLAALQARTNGGLGAELDDGLTAALFSFASGLAVACVLLTVVPSARRGLALGVAALRDGTAPWWLLFGGAAGAFTIFTQSFVVELIGVALFTVGLVSGQTLSSLLVDRFAPRGLPQRAITTPRVIGALLALAAVAVDVLFGREFIDAQAWLLVLPFLAGGGLGWQIAANGLMQKITGSGPAAAFINFTVGAAVLAVFAGIHLLIAGPPAHWPSNPALYLGGLIGVVFVSLQSLLVRVTGVLLLVLASLSGQLLGAIAVDLLVPLHGESLTVWDLVEAVIVLIAVVVASWPGRSARSAESTVQAR
jgi:transporter family-2 protein